MGKLFFPLDFGHVPSLAFMQVLLKALSVMCKINVGYLTLVFIKSRDKRGLLYVLEGR